MQSLTQTNIFHWMVRWQSESWYSELPSVSQVGLIRPVFRIPGRYKRQYHKIQYLPWGLKVLVEKVLWMFRTRCCISRTNPQFLKGPGNMHLKVISPLKTKHDRGWGGIRLHFQDSIFHFKPKQTIISTLKWNTLELMCALKTETLEWKSVCTFCILFSVPSLNSNLTPKLLSKGPGKI